MSNAKAIKAIYLIFLLIFSSCLGGENKKSTKETLELSNKEDRCWHKVKFYSEKSKIINEFPFEFKGDKEDWVTHKLDFKESFVDGKKKCHFSFTTHYADIVEVNEELYCDSVTRHTYGGFGSGAGGSFGVSCVVAKDKKEADEKIKKGVGPKVYDTDKRLHATHAYATITQK